MMNKNETPSQPTTTDGDTKPGNPQRLHTDGRKLCEDGDGEDEGKGARKDANRVQRRG